MTDSCLPKAAPYRRSELPSAATFLASATRLGDDFGGGELLVGVPAHQLGGHNLGGCRWYR
jgi:hypothetical protein